jgi:hypothetical protein
MEMPFAQVAVGFRRPYRLVPQEHLDRADVSCPHHQIARERVSPGAEIRILDAKSSELAAEFRFERADVYLSAVLLGESPAALKTHRIFVLKRPNIYL